ncbi:hypothetical protein BDV59DRAFT_208252 [Aspergillus ambiguus]|uniref:uncharacterized protein n=1 Tax=Aspergillus ambiguus TaxID=176160 RepID=UPI003CCDE32E
MCRDTPSCTNESGLLEQGTATYTACHAITHPDIPFRIYESILLSSWVAVICGYYNESKIGLGNVRVKPSEAMDGFSTIGYTSLKPDRSMSIRHLRSNIVQLERSLPLVNLSDVKDECLVVTLPPVKENGAEKNLVSSVLQIAGIIKPRLMLAIQPSGENARVNLSSHSEKPSGFRLCGILDSLKKAVYTSMYNPSQILSNIDIVSNYDMRRLKRWVVKPTFEGATTIQHLINRHYHERPNAPAISTTSESISYEELGKLSAILAKSLRAKGVGSGSKVGFCMEKSSDAVVALIGILRAGAAYVPIDIHCPTDRMENIIDKASIKHMVVDGHMPRHDMGIEVTNAESLREGLPPSDWTTEHAGNPSDAAYIMFTSGSTGTPKGAVHMQQGVAGGLLEVAKAFGLGVETRFLQYAAFSFDASICEIFAPLVVGGTVCVPSQQERLEGLQSVMRQLKITDASLTPVIVRQLEPAKTPHLKHLYIGGEAPSAEIINLWSEQVRLSNIYGTTETGVWDTINLHLKNGDDPKNIGRGIGTTCWIVDPSNIEKPQPVGVEGELVIQSPYIGRGYLDNDEKNASSFTLAPAWAQNLSGCLDSRIYRTGDLAKYNSDGTILFRGRQSGFVKLRGLRIELGEIESCLNSLFPSGKSAVILAKMEEQGNDAELAAFVEAPMNSSILLADHIQEKLSKTLPRYMIPTIAIPIENMPLTESKKISRQELRRRLADMSASALLAFRPGGSSVRRSKQIDPARSFAIQIGHTIIDMVGCKEDTTLESLRGRDFPLSSVGLNSVHLAYLSGYIRRNWGFPVTVGDLQRPGMTVCDIEQLAVNGECRPPNPKSINTNILEKLREMKPVEELHPEPPKLTVLCTSITGFLGSQILRSLLECSNVGQIISIVRADSERKALERVKEQAVIGKWWREEFNSRIAIWIGDLGQPNLGLEPKFWRMFRGDSGHTSIDAVIHNGARVNWLETFDTLKPTNVNSTVEILRAVSNMPNPCSLTYISGGYLPSPAEAKEEIAHKLSHASGYDQTKFLSRLILEDYNAHLNKIGNATMHRARIIQPGFIVGTTKEGIAQTEDFLWRLAYTILEIGTVSEKLREAYIPVAGVDQISSLVVQSILSGAMDEITDCRDGIHFFHFCDILSAKTGKKILMEDHDKWLESVKSNIENATLDHPFLPVLDWFEENYWQFSPEACSPAELLFDTRDVYAAIEKSVEYLVNIGYLPAATTHSEYRAPNSVPVFRRSSR